MQDIANRHQVFPVGQTRFPVYFAGPEANYGTYQGQISHASVC